MSRHTYGIWRVVPGGRVVADLLSGTTVQVCRIGDYADPDMLEFDWQRWEGDAHLIAAAPEMLKALKWLFDEYETRRAQFGSDPLWKMWEDTDAVEEARRVLEKLKGVTT